VSREADLCIGALILALAATTFGIIDNQRRPATITIAGGSEGAPVCVTDGGSWTRCEIGRATSSAAMGVVSIEPAPVGSCLVIGPEGRPTWASCTAPATTSP